MSFWWRIPQWDQGSGQRTERSPLKPNDYQLLDVERKRQCLIHVIDVYYSKQTTFNREITGNTRHFST